MKVVIDISEEDYQKVQDGRASVSMMRDVIRNGTPLRKGHGRFRQKVEYASTIIEADAVESED